MKTIISKFKIHEWTYVFFFLAFCMGMFQRVLILFSILVIHEIGHLFFIQLFSYPVIKVVFYPFGGICKVSHRINDSILKDLVISLGGIISQLILEIILLRSSILNKELFLFYNQMILIFNLLPIIPLDGSVFWHHFLEFFFSFELSLKVYEIVSLIFLFGFFLYNIFFQVHNYFMCLVLLGQYHLYLKSKKHYVNRFYLERYLEDFPYSKIKNEKGRNYRVLRKNTRHFFYEDNKYYSEKEILKNHFDKMYIL